MGSADSLTTVLDLIDWTRLPSSTRPIASMLVSGLTQTEIAAQLRPRRSPDYVAGQVRLLREAIVEQALEQVDRLEPSLRELVEGLSRSVTAGGVGGGLSRRPRTGSTTGTSRSAA